jgi:voltage-gated potassium channel Kch
MAEAHAEVNGRPVGGRGRAVVRLLGFLGIVSGAAALGLAAMGWLAELGPPRDFNDGVDLVIRTVKVLLLSDIYYEDWKPRALVWLEPARALGVLASLLIGARLLILAIGARVSDWFVRHFTSKHHVVIGDGAAAREYAASHNHLFKGRAIHLSKERLPAARRLATVERRGSLQMQLHQAAARRARRIVVDEGDDADTWQTAQLAGQLCPKADVLAHISDPWIRDRLSRDRSSTQRATPRLAPFSYAGGAARQVMLAHPPYLLAQALEAKAQHILVVGFGQVGQEVAREFIVTCVTPGDAKLMVTVIDPDAETTLAPDFNGRHEELVKHVDFDFIGGDFRLSDARADGLFERLKKRADKAPICAVYVAIDLDHKPLGLAFAIRAMALRHGLFLAPIFVCAQHGAGLPTVRHGIGMVGGPPEVQEEREKQATTEGKLCNLRVVSFGSWSAAFDGAGMLEQPYDTQARRYHEEYSRRYAEAERQKSGAVTGGVTPWSNLPDQLRISNRRAAAHMRAKAFAVNFDVGRWLAADGGYRFTQELPPAAGAFKDEADPDPVMSRLEHQRWMLDRFLDGWRPGGRSDYYRTRKTLVPFEQLDPSEVAKDNAVVETTRALMKEAASAKRKKR